MKNKIPFWYYFYFLFFSFFLPSAFAGGLSYPETKLVEEELEKPQQVVVVNNYYNNHCQEQVVYYQTPGMTIGGGVINSALSYGYAGGGFNQALAVASASSGAFGMVGVSGLTQPVIKGCWAYQKENQGKGEYK